jgi:hypothetical protein
MRILSHMMKGMARGGGGGSDSMLNWIFVTVIGLAIFGSSIGAGFQGINTLANNSSILGTAGTVLIGLTGLIVAAVFIMKIYKSGRLGR